MIATAHFISGALVAKKIKNAYLAWLLAFASHFLLDAIFHSEYSGHKNWIVLLVIDLLIGILSVLWITKDESRKNKWRIWIGAILANVPDMLSFSFRLFLPLIAAIPLIGNLLSVFLSKFFAFHFWAHAGPPPSFLLGTLTQVFVIIFSFILYQKSRQ